MTANLFAEQLSKQAPPMESVLKIGLSLEYAQNAVGKYRCVPEVKSIPDLSEDFGVLFDLIESFDLSSVAIGMITFNRSIEKHGANWLVGSCEADLLMVSSETGEVYVEEHATDHHVLWKCAENGEKFLKSLLIVAGFLGRCGVDEKLYSDPAAAKATADQCVVVAGGERYRSFFSMICGCF